MSKTTPKMRLLVSTRAFVWANEVLFAEDSTQLERDAAAEVKKAYCGSVSVDAEVLFIVQGFKARVMAQNRYGK